MALLTSNYNVLQCSKSDKEKYSVGQVFEVLGRNRFTAAFMRFDGLEIKNITFGFGVFLHFDLQEWEKNAKPIDSPGEKVESYLF